VVIDEIEDERKGSDVVVLAATYGLLARVPQRRDDHPLKPRSHIVREARVETDDMIEAILDVFAQAAARVA
jgi:hypothetical protein